MPDEPEEASSLEDYSSDYPSTTPATKSLGIALAVGTGIFAVVAIIVAIAVSAANRERDEFAEAAPQRVAPRFVPRPENMPPLARQEPSLVNVEQRTGTPSGIAAGAFYLVAGLACGLTYILGLILILAWVAKDARNRGIDGGAMWVIVCLVLHFVGLLVYLASRPHGMLSPCHVCGNQRLQYARLCPHCGRK